MLRKRGQGQGREVRDRVEVEVAPDYIFKATLVKTQSKHVCKGLLFQPNRSSKSKLAKLCMPNACSANIDE